VEIASSLDFLWKQQARKELEEMSEMRRHTNQLLQNLLPLHVAKFFLHCDRKRQDLFSLNSFEFVHNCTSTNQILHDLLLVHVAKLLLHCEMGKR
jgi:hypothetical protein